jgi:hypothetical protein
MATCEIKGCKIKAASKDNYCTAHSAELERRADEEDVQRAIELVRKTPWTVLWCVKHIIDGHHPNAGDIEWLADTQAMNDSGRLELRNRRFHYKVDGM